MRSTLMVLGFALFVILLSIGRANSFENAKVIAPPIAAENQRLVTSQLEKKSEEIIVLRAQNQLMQDYQGTMIDIVLWSLTGISTIAVLVAGFGWWSNFKIYENDKKRLQEEVDSNLAQQIAQLEVRLQSTALNLERSIDAKVEANLSRAHSDLATLRSEFSDIKKKCDALQEQVNESKRQSYLARSELRAVEENIWEIKEIPEAILMTQIQGLLADRAGNDMASARVTLSRMKRTLNKWFVDTERELNRTSVELIKDNIDRFVDSLGAEITEVKQLLSKVKLKADT
ncbi:hypothetical protein [Massilia sp. SYSU DXS3249]